MHRSVGRDRQTAITITQLFCPLIEIQGKISLPHRICVYSDFCGCFPSFFVRDSLICMLGVHEF